MKILDFMYHNVKWSIYCFKNEEFLNKTKCGKICSTTDILRIQSINRIVLLWKIKIHLKKLFSEKWEFYRNHSSVIDVCLCWSQTSCYSILYIFLGNNGQWLCAVALNLLNWLSYKKLHKIKSLKKVFWISFQAFRCVMYVVLVIV